MTTTRFALFAATTLLFCAFAEDYPLGPDSERHPGVPQGTVTKYTWKDSKIFPGTERDYWVYVPAQYSKDKPAALMVFQDGGGYITDTGAWRAHIVFDNLIARGEMPVTIGVFINPGVMPARSTQSLGRFNRSYEYDAIGDRYSQFLLTEILPEVSKSYNITTDPNLRGIGGSSSGAICAFTVAWLHPESFRRVLSTIGSYTNLRGGNIYPSWVRKTEPKPLRVFLQDGDHDLNIFVGNWWIGNQDLASALEYAGYDTTHVWGTEGHNSKHGGSILPYALRWLWRESSKPIVASQGGGGERQFSTTFLDPAEGWQLVSEGHKFTEGPAVDKQGNVFFTDIPNNRIHRVTADGVVSVFKEDTGAANGLVVGGDGRLYACQNGRKRIVAYTMDGREIVLAEDVNSNDLVISNRNDIYFTDPNNHRVWYLDPKGNKRVVAENLGFPNGLAFSPDQTLLYVNDTTSKSIWSYQIQDDGTLTNGEPFYRLELHDDFMRSGADGMKVDVEGQLFVATKLGIQICDQPGRVVAIWNKPGNADISNLAFGGPARDILFVTAGDKVFKRKVRRQGTVSWELIKPPQPRL
ncbi:SMP-30/gluconolactonase/LRE family protein [Paludibaculum fermentans]|uniref:SMP-30/gluconolactonase/LRE family protein n=1 Tax=Paludibaculum fermentans TaxID=1473598 RepID=A0A7S7NRQ9_PALFE|nr:SMP-30/gluconolactonase/LRE family protein [Paludibaculum fermentans]QOY88607.1 SMP-30/gluconolactonase/LRE family protein [Paludibaculum fermentans]